MFARFLAVPLALLGAVCLMQPASPAAAQTLSETMDELFGDVLEVELAGPFQHGEHYTFANVETNQAIEQAFTTLIGGSLANFPLSSTVSGLTFDFSSGAPVATTTSLGPIFAERAQTIGRRRVNVGANVSLLYFDKFRGVPTDGLRFSFAHQNIPARFDEQDPGFLGDNPNEFDVLNMDLALKVSAQIVAFYTTVGVTDRLDVNVAVPVIHAHIKAEETATFDSFTLAFNGTPNHFFYSGADTVLTFNQTLINAATGIGDVALRSKYRFYGSPGFDAAALLDLRLPTGDEENFLGTGETRVRAHAILSWNVGSGFYPHVNTGFQFRNADTETNAYEVVAGFDQKLAEHVTFAADFLGEYQLGEAETPIAFPAPVVVSGDLNNQILPLTKVIDPTNIPDRKDNLTSGSFGVKWSPRPNLLFIGNAIVAFNNGGIRAEVVPTLGLEYSF